jgi:hypothetical protein
VGATVTPASDVEVYYSYSPTRNSDDVNNGTFTKIESSLLTQAYMDDDSKGEKYDTLLEGLYNLKLPLSYFNQKGYYTVYIKPKEYMAVLSDVGVLSSYPDVKGIVIDAESDTLDSSLSKLLKENNALVGYRVIYYDDNYARQPYYRIVTSNNRCEPVIQNLSDVNQKAVRYRYNENSSLVFLTLTPSVATTYKPNATPYIGVSMQKVGIVNTKFEPVMVEIEMVEHDLESVSTMLEGSQLRDLDNGLVTTFNSDNEIYAQHEHYTLKDEYTGQPIYEVKKNKQDSIDFTQTLEDKME